MADADEYMKAPTAKPTRVVQFGSLACGFFRLKGSDGRVFFGCKRGGHSPSGHGPTHHFPVFIDGTISQTGPGDGSTIYPDQEIEMLASEDLGLSIREGGALPWRDQEST